MNDLMIKLIFEKLKPELKAIKHEFGKQSVTLTVNVELGAIKEDEGI